MKRRYNVRHLSAWAATGGLVIVLAFVVWPHHHSAGTTSSKQPPENGQAAGEEPEDAVKIVGPGSLFVAPASPLEKKLGVVHLTPERVTYPQLVVTGSILARRSADTQLGPWQFASSEIATAYADYLKANNETEFAERQRANVVRLTSLQQKRAEEVRARVQRLVETGTEATKALVAAEAEAAQTKLEGERDVYEATNALSVAVRARDAAEQQLVQAGLQPEVLAKTVEKTAILAAEVPEARISAVHEKQPCEARFYGIPDAVFDGQVSRLAPVLSTERRTLGVLVQLPDPEERLRPGMFGEVGLGTDPRDALLVPADAVIHMRDDDYVLVRAGEDTWKVTQVHVGEPREGRIELLSGVSANVDVVGSGAILLKRHALAAVTGGASP